MPQFPPLKSGIIISPTSQDLGRITLVDIFPGGSDSKESVCNVGDPGSILGRIPGEENGNPPQNSCQEKSHGWRSLLSYSPWSHRESDMTERLAYTLVNGLTQLTQRKRIHLHCSRCRFNPWVEKIPWRRAWQPAPVFLPGKSHGQRSLAGYSPWGRKGVGYDLVTKQQHWLMVTQAIIRNKIIIIHVLIKDIQRACPSHHVRTQ